MTVIMYNTIAIIITAMLSITTAQADNLPSNEDLMRLGHQKLGDFNEALDKAQRSVNMQPMRPTEVPPDTQIHSPVERAMLDEAVANSRNLGQQPSSKKTSDLMVFVSFSMPDDALKDYTEQAREAGATIVLRGMVGNSLQKTKLKAWQVSHGRSAWEINPGIFRKFKVTRVPAIVLAQGDSHVTESGCASPASYLRVDGAVAVRQALLLMRRYGDQPLADDAAARLDKLEKQK